MSGFMNLVNLYLQEWDLTVRLIPAQDWSKKALLLISMHTIKLIKQAGEAMRDELKERGLEVISPYIEIYGHWTADETRLETELLMGLRF